MSQTMTATMTEAAAVQVAPVQVKTRAVKTAPGMKELRAAIPAHCFEADAVASLGYIFADLTAIAGLVILGLQIPSMESWIARAFAWTAYGWAQGLIFTGLWILAHECGHAALFKSRLVNDVWGFLMHTFLAVPYFPWKYTHARHHRYANNMEKDTVFVPSRGRESQMVDYLCEMLDLGEDAPIVNFVVLLGHQLIGWQAYLLGFVTAGESSLSHSKREQSSRQSHFDPQSDVFRDEEKPFVLLTDIGLAAVLAALYFAGTKVGFGTVALLYGVPYLWVNHWIVAITYLHHTHPEAKHFEADAWTFQKGAQMTIDRDFGFIGKHLFHGIIEFHVIHHLFARIPFYYAEEATEHIKPLLGDQYLRQDTSFLKDLWTTFVSCKYVQPSAEDKGALVWTK